MPFGLSAGAIAAIGAGVSAAGGIATSLIQSGASKSGASSANAAQQQMLDQTRADLGPYNTAGQNALGVASNLAGANGPDAATAAMANFYTSPGYQFRLGEGLRAVDAGAAGQGILRSGATLKAEQKYGEGLASSEFDNYYNRLYQLSSLGENAAAQQGNANTATGQGMAATDRNAAQQQSDIYGNIGKGLSSATNTLFNNKDFTNWAFGPGTSTPGVTDPSTGYTTAAGMTNAGYQLAPGF